MNSNTPQQVDEALHKCFLLFSDKLKDYGTAWRIMRLSSLTDQIMIKARRVRSIEIKGTQMIADSIEGEFIGMLNYSIIALIQLKLGVAQETDIDATEAENHFLAVAEQAKDLLSRKNHDYGEAWREMRISSYTDLILQKLLRIKQIEENKGKTLVSENIDANYLDIINYSLFALIKFDELKNTQA